MVFYKTSEFASLIGVSATTVRTWERRGYLLPHHRSPSGYRYYSDEQVAQYFKGQLINKKTDTQDEEVEVS